MLFEGEPKRIEKVFNNGNMLAQSKRLKLKLHVLGKNQKLPKKLHCSCVAVKISSKSVVIIFPDLITLAWSLIK